MLYGTQEQLFPELAPTNVPFGTKPGPERLYPDKTRTATTAREKKDALIEVTQQIHEGTVTEVPTHPVHAGLLDVAMPPGVQVICGDHTVHRGYVESRNAAANASLTALSDPASSSTARAT